MRFLTLQKRRTYKRKTFKDRPICDTAEEAIKTMLAERKLSSKINYDVLRGLKSEDGTEDSSDVTTLVPKAEKIETPSSGRISEMNIVYETGPTSMSTTKRGVKRK